MGHRPGCFYLSANQGSMIVAGILLALKRIRDGVVDQKGRPPIDKSCSPSFCAGSSRGMAGTPQCEAAGSLFFCRVCPCEEEWNS